MNREKLEELRRAHGIRNDAELARLLGIAPSTLFRLTTGRTKPSNDFMAALLGAFPLASLDDLVILREAM